MTISLPEGLQLRAPHMHELQAVAAFIIACDIADVGEPDYSEDELLNEWQRDNFNLATDARIVITPQDEIVGYTDVCHEDTAMFISPNTYVHPTYRDQGIERLLYDFAELRAHQYAAELKERRGPETPTTIWTIAVDEITGQILEQMGFTLTKREMQMEIKLDEPPPAPQWPDGFTIRTFIPDEDEHIVHNLIETCFAELTGHKYEPFEHWESWAIKQSRFDPTLIHLAMHSEEVIGVVFCRNYPTGGWIHQVAVLRPWRGKGIASQLLRTVFGEYYRRGTKRIGLTVDPHNVTGAQRVYEQELT
jgi:mycothiol synthase